MTNQVVQLSIGLTGVRPGMFMLESNDTYAEIIFPGYINNVPTISSSVETGDYFFANYSNGAFQTIFTAQVELHGIITLIPMAGNGTPSDFKWNPVDTPTQTLVNQNGYVVVDFVTFSLPPVAVFGEFYRIAGPCPDFWTITQGINQRIIMGNQQSTPGSGGSISATEPGDCADILCIVPNTLFQIIGDFGNLNII